MRKGGGFGQKSDYGSKVDQSYSDKLRDLREKLTKAMKKQLGEILYKNKKTGIVQSLDPNHPEDKEVLKDPQFNQLFTKA